MMNWKRMILRAAVCALTVIALAGCGQSNTWEDAAELVPASVSDSSRAGEDTAEAESEDDFRFSYGFGDMARPGRWLPVRLSVAVPDDTASGEGTLSLMMQGEDTRIVRYDYPVHIQAGSRLEVKETVPLEKSGRGIHIILTDVDGNRLADRHVQLMVNDDSKQNMVGVLAGNPAAMEWLDRVTLEDGQKMASMVYLDPQDAPEEAMAYDALDMLVITDFDLDRLSELQISALDSYVKNGGVLLFGGGVNYEKTMGSYGRLYLEQHFPAVEVDISAGPELAELSPAENTIRLQCADLSLRGGQVLMEGENIPLLSGRALQRGMLVTSAFSLEDIGDYSDSNPEFARTLLSLALGRSREKKDNGIYDYDAVQDLVQGGDEEHLPDLALYAVLLIVYIITVVPVAYMLLQRMDRRRYYPAVVALAVLVFTILMYMAGVNTRFTGPFYQYATLFDLDHGTIEETTWLNIRSPYNRNYDAVLSDYQAVRPLFGGEQYPEGTSLETAGPENYSIRICPEEGKTSVRIKPVGAFAPACLSLSTGQTEWDGNPLTADVNLFEDNVAGQVFNGSEHDLSDAAIIYYGKAIPIGTLKAGETAQLKGLPVLNWPLGREDLLAEEIVCYDAGRDKKSDADRLVTLQRRKLLAFAMQKRMDEASDGVYLVAFGEKDTKPLFLEKDYRKRNPDGSEVTAQGSAMVMVRLDYHTEDRGLTYRMALQQEPKVISGTYDSNSNIMEASGFGNGLVLEYSLGSDLELSRVDMDQLSEMFTSDRLANTVEMFRGTISFYNYDTGKFDAMPHRESYSAEEMAPYLSPSNTLTVRYDSDSAGEELYLPVLWAVGSKH